MNATQPNCSSEQSAGEQSAFTHERSAKAAEFTPGPWMVVTRQIIGSYDCQPVVVPADSSLDFDDVAQVVVPEAERSGGRDVVSAWANARLIAAAPKLLEALVEMVGHAEAVNDMLPLPRRFCASLHDAKAAITKASK